MQESRFGFLVIAVLSLCIMIWTRGTARHPNLESGRRRALRNHLKEFVKLWGALTLYYILEYFWSQISSFAARSSFLGLTQYVSPSLGWHLAVALLLACANLWLRRASLELEISGLPGKQGTNMYPDTIKAPWLRDMLRSSDKLIAFAFLAALLLLIAAPAFPSSAEDMIKMADEVQVGVTTWLFLGLASAYLKILHAPWLSAMALIYAGAQLPYSLWTKPGELTAYCISLALLKIIFACSLCITVGRRAAKADTMKEEDPSQVMTRIAKRHEAKALQQKLFQVVAAAASLALWMLIYASIYSHLIDASKGMPRAIVILERWILTVPLLLGVQAILFLVLKHLRYRVGWEALAEKVLNPQQGIAYSTMGHPRPGFRCFTLERQERQAAGVAAGRSGGRQQAILIHGLLTDGASAWGLLPLWLLRKGDVTAVHIVTYDHGLLTTRKQLDKIATDLQILCNDLICPFDGTTVLVGHSLGAILTLKLLPGLFSDARDTQDKVRQVCLAGPPLLGSGYATLLLPYPWAWNLGRRSSLLVDVLRESEKQLPAIGTKDGEVRFPALSLIMGTRDGIVGELIEFTNLSNKRVKVTAYHGLGAVFDETDPLTLAYLSVLKTPDRAETLAGRVAEHLGLGGAAGESGVFSLHNGRIGEAFVVRSLLQHQTAPGVTVDPRPLHDALRQGFMAAGGSVPGWQQLWAELVSLSQRSPKPTIIVAQWPGNRRLVIYWNHFTGCFGVCEGGIVAGGQALVAGPPVLGTAQLHAYLPSLELSAARGVLGESCDHVGRMARQGVIFTRLVARAVLDRNGSYYGIYSLHGHAGAGERVHLRAHIGAAGAPRWADLGFSAFEENRHQPLRINRHEEGLNCYFIELDAGAPFSEGGQVAVRYSFRQHRRVSLVDDVDCYRLMPILPAGTEVDVRLQFPDRCRDAEALVLHEGRVQKVDLAERSGNAIQVKYRVEDGDDALALKYSVDSTRQSRRLIDLVTIEVAGPGDHGQMAGMESILAIGRPLSKEEIEKRAAEFPSGLIVARIADSVVGYVNYIRWTRTELAGLRREELMPIERHHDPNGLYAFVWFLAVLPAFEKEGIGRALVERAANTASLAGCSQLQLVALPDLQALFESMRFEVAARLDSYLPLPSGDRRLGLLMKRTLAGFAPRPI